MHARPGGGSAAPPSWLVFVAVLVLHGAVFAAFAMSHAPARGIASSAQVTTVRLLSAPQANVAPPPAAHPLVHMAAAQSPVLPAPRIAIAAPRRPVVATTVLRNTVAQPADRNRLLQHYAVGLWARIAAHKRHGLHRAGHVQVTFALDSQGHLLWVKLAQSSGDAGLDAAALMSVRAAAPFQPAPAGLVAADLVFTIPFDFS